MHVGIYIHVNPAVRMEKHVAIEDLIPNAYTPMEVGTLDLGTDALLSTDIWVSAKKNPEVMNAIYVDRIVFIREKDNATK